MKIKSKKAIALAYILAIVWGLVIVGMTKHQESDPQIVTFVPYTVTEGDTLWDIAKRNPHGDMDIREFIYDLERMNNINPQLQVGAEILIPVYEGSE